MTQSLIKYFREFPKRIKFASLSLDVDRLCVRSEYEQARRRLVEVYALFNAKMPSPSVSLDVNLRCAQIACRQEDYALAVSAAKIVLTKIDETKRYSPDKKNYVRYFCKIILEYCEAKTNYQTFDSRLIDVRFSSLRFDKVGPILKSNFPISGPVSSELDP